jgi:hypothetical protein
MVKVKKKKTIQGSKCKSCATIVVHQSNGQVLYSHTMHMVPGPQPLELGSFGGQLHTQSHPIKGKNPVVWYLLANLSEFHTQKIKRSQKYIG